MKLDRINEDIVRTKDKIASLQSRLRELERQKTETENTEIIALVRAMNADNQGDFNALLETLRQTGLPSAPVIRQDARGEEAARSDAAPGYSTTGTEPSTV